MESGKIPDSRITASSYFKEDFRPQNIKSNRRYSWRVAKGNDTLGQWIQVDLGGVENIFAMKTNDKVYYNSVREWVRTFSIQYSNDGKNFTDYKNGKTFYGLLRKLRLRPMIRAQYIRILPKTWRRWISMKLELYTSSFGKYKSLIRNVPDSRITASSYWYFEFPTTEGRLNNHFKALNKPGAWKAEQSHGQWIQIDLGNVTTVTGIATQGNPSGPIQPSWVKSYILQYSIDGKWFELYLDGKVFAGNTDRNTIVRNDLTSPIHARYIRVYPITWNGDVAMRMELFGCKSVNPLLKKNVNGILDESYCFFLIQKYQSITCLSWALKRCTSMLVSKCKPSALGMENGDIPDSSISASSYIGTKFLPAYVKDVEKNYLFWEVAKKDNRPGQWIQVDLGNVTNITAIATQGSLDRYEQDARVKTYSLQYSVDGKIFTDYQGGKTLDGGKTYSFKKHVLNPPIVTRYIKLLPKTWERWIKLEMRLYQSTDPYRDFVKDIPDSSFTASSFYRYEYSPQQGRLNNQHIEYINPGAWIPEFFQNESPWMQIDLGNVTFVTGVDIQGGIDYGYGVHFFSLEYSNDGKTFYDHLDEVFYSPHVTWDQIQRINLPVAIHARYIRVYPKWRNPYRPPSMRVELYGCKTAGLTTSSIISKRRQ